MDKVHDAAMIICGHAAAASKTGKWKLLEEEAITQLRAAHIAGLKEALEIAARDRPYEAHNDFYRGVNCGIQDVVDAITARIAELEKDSK